MRKTIAPVLAEAIGDDLHEGSDTCVLIDPTHFHELMVSHRRMVREDDVSHRQRGLRDLDTGELFVVDERRLLDVANKKKR